MLDITQSTVDIRIRGIQQQIGRIHYSHGRLPHIAQPLRLPDSYRRLAEQQRLLMRMGIRAIQKRDADIRLVRQ